MFHTNIYWYVIQCRYWQSAISEIAVFVSLVAFDRLTKLTNATVAFIVSSSSLLYIVHYESISMELSELRLLQQRKVPNTDTIAEKPRPQQQMALCLHFGSILNCNRNSLIEMNQPPFGYRKRNRTIECKKVNFVVIPFIIDFITLRIKRNYQM